MRENEMIGMLVLLIFVLIISFLIVAEKVFERTNYYLKNFGETDKLKGTDKVDFVNSGSTFAYYGIDYGLAGVKGLNLALCPQSLLSDFKMLKHYEGRYNKGATVFIVISDLAFAKEGYTETLINGKYYKILNRKEIDCYDLFEAIRAKYFPVLYSWKNFLRFHWDIRPGGEVELEVNENDREAVEADAYQRGNAWMEEFGLKNLRNGRQGDKFCKEFSYTAGVVKDMVLWCLKRGYRPIIVNLPVTAEMEKHFSQEFLNAFYYGQIKNILDSVGNDVSFIDLQKNEKLSDYLLYLDSCRLNKAGREIITKILIREAGN